MAVLSGARVLRVLCMCVCVCVCAGPLLMGGMMVRWGCIRVCSVVYNSAAPGRASTKHTLFLMMPKRREWAKSVSESGSDLNKL